MGIDLNNIIEIVVRWAPTIMFAATLFIAALVGLIRGLRKSVILLIHAAVAATLCIVAFFILTKSEKVDEMILTIINQIMGHPTALQVELGVSTSLTSLREVIMEFIPTQLDAGDSFVILFEENKEYLLTLVDVVYNLVFAILLYVVYLVLLFVLYIVYFLFYPQRRYKRKKKKEGTYKKRALLGSAVGFARGLVAGVISLSLIGSALYVVSGGTGEDPMVEYSFEDDKYNQVYGAYRSVSSYGSTGIYKVLNAFKDKNDQPYYLFAADLIFSGNLTEEDLQINETIKFREEIGTYLGFAKDTVNLLIKYGGEEVEGYLSNSEEASMDGIVAIMQQEEFQEEFSSLIDNFDSKTYFINLTFSLITTLINHIDEMAIAESLDESVVEMIKILFKKGHYSDYIPDEKEVKYSRKERKKSKELSTLPYINISQLITKDDVLTMFEIVCELLSNETNEGEQVDALKAVRSILPHVEELSILNGSRKEEFDPIFTRLYCYVENRYLTVEGYDGVRYSDIVNKRINWTNELCSLVSVAENVIDMYQNVYVPEVQPMDIILSIFDSEHECYEENMGLYDEISDTICSSKILGQVLSSSSANKMIDDALSGAINGVHLQDDMTFVNTYDNNGNEIKKGELHLLFSSLKILGSPENKKLVETLFSPSEEGDESKINAETLTMLSDALESKDSNGKSLVGYLEESELLRSVLSAFIIEFSKGEEALLYVPSDCLESENGEKINLLKLDEYKELLEIIPDIIDVAGPLIEGNGSFEEIQELLKDEKLHELMDKNNKIIEGTFSKMFIDLIDQVDYLILPSKLSDVDSWLSNKQQDGELKKIINFITKTDIDLSSLMEGQANMSALSGLKEEDFDRLFDSSVMYYSISNIITGNLIDMNEFKLIVPNTCKVTLQDDVISYLVSKDELKSMLLEFTSFDFSSTTDFSTILVQFVKKFIDSDNESKNILQKSKIISASLINFVVTSEGISNFISIPEVLKQEVNDKTNYGLENYSESYKWYNELPNMIYSLEEVFEISTKDSFAFDAGKLTEAFSTLLSSFSDKSHIAKKASLNMTRLDVCYESLIIKDNITVKFEDALCGGDTPLVDQNTVNDAKDDQGYLKKQELYALSDVMDVFDINIDSNMQMDSNFANKFKDKLFTLNDVLADEKYQNKTSLDVMYESTIIVSLLSNELDKILQDIVSTNVLDYGNVKDEKGKYLKSEMSAMVNAVNALDIKSMNDLSTTDFSIKKIKDNIDTIYESKIIAGAFTKQLKDTINTTSVLADHPNAYVSPNIDIYHKHEVVALLNMLGDKEVDTISISDVSLDDIRKSIYDEENLERKTSSYILVATVSKNLMDSISNGADNVLVIPESCIEVVNHELTTILPIELGKLLYSLKAIGITSLSSDKGINAVEHLFVPKQGSFDDSNPSAERRNTIVDSIIMRATFTKMMLTLEQNKADSEAIMFSLNNIEQENGEFIKDHNGNKIAVVNKEQLLLIFSALDVFITDPDAENSLELPSFSSISDVLLVKDHIDELYVADPVRYRISSVLASYVSEKTPEEAYDIISSNTSTQQVVSLEKLKQFVGLV